jgi:hypothetical protein
LDLPEKYQAQPKRRESEVRFAVGGSQCGNQSHADLGGGNAIRGTLMCGTIQMRAFVVLGMLLLLASAQSTSAQRHRDLCGLLTDAEVRAVQRQVPTQKIQSEQRAGAFRFTQCFYRTQRNTNEGSMRSSRPILINGSTSCSTHEKQNIQCYITRY